MLYTEVQYLKRVSFRLGKFKIKKDTGTDFIANCKCNYCEPESNKKNKKSRGYFFSKVGKLFYFCHNCNASESFAKWLKGFDSSMYKEYSVEMFKDRHVTIQTSLPLIPEPSTKRIDPDIFVGLQTIEELPDGHPAKTMVTDRRIPNEFLSGLYYAPKFFDWVAGHTKKFEGMQSKDHPRWVIPMFARDGSIMGYQARAYGSETPKYYSMILNKNEPKIFGLERVNWSERVYVVEGPVDSLFLPNGVAVCDSALYKFDTDETETTYIPDNERRNTEILKVYAKLIDLGKDVCMLPETWKYKDLNDAAKDGVSSLDIKRVIDDNTYQGLRAKMKFTEWKKR